jgi:hypothetical protein
VHFHVAALPDSLLGLTRQTTIWIDPNAQGYGWYIDASASSNAAFTQVTGTNEVQAAPGSPAFGHVDLLTVVTHELGHVLGFASIDTRILSHGWMTATLPTGIRRYPDPARAGGPVSAPGAPVLTATVRTSDGGTGAIGSPSLEVIASLVASSDPDSVGSPTPRTGASPSDGTSTGRDAIAAPSPLDLVDASLLDPALGPLVDRPTRGFNLANLRAEIAHRPRFQRTVSALRPEQVDAFLEHIARRAVAQPLEERRAHFKAGRVSVWR